MKAIVLVDNISRDNLAGEWGLSIYIEYAGKTILLDAGASGLFLRNAKQLGLDIGNVDYAVLSHAHYDHADGMAVFFQENAKAKCYLRDGCGENCYVKHWLLHKYIGISRGILDQYRDRIVYAKGDYSLFPGVTLIPHRTEGLAEIGKKNHMVIRDKSGWKPDDFSHEQSLVFETKEGLAVFNSCSHGGADNIIREVAAVWPGQKIRALVGGFHLYDKPAKEVQAFAARVKATGIEAVYTGHCTGERPFQILEEELGNRVCQLHTGMVMEWDGETRNLEGNILERQSRDTEVKG